MRSTRQMSVTLPYAMADAVRARVESGEYASESEVIREGLRALLERERAVETWLLGPVAAACAAIRTETVRPVSVGEVRRSLRKGR